MPSITLMPSACTSGTSGWINLYYHSTNQSSAQPRQLIFTFPANATLGGAGINITGNRGVIHIRRNVVHPTRNRPVVGDTKTKLSKRVLTISQIALPYIQEAERRAGERSDFVFGGREPLSYTQHRQMMHRISNQMNIKGITGYTFRHTVITDIYETTHDANIASAVAGHSKTSITMNHYSHTRQDAIRKGIDALNKTYNL